MGANIFVITLLDLVIRIHRLGAQLIELGMPVQELSALPVLAQARRLKQTYSSEQVGEIRAFADQVADRFEQLRIRYSESGASA